MNKYLIICSVLSVLVCGLLIADRKKIIESRDRYKENTETLLSNIRQYKLDSTKTAIESSRLQLTLDEYKKYREDDIKTIKDLGLKLKQIKASMKHDISIEVPIKTPVKDSIIIESSTPLLVKTFDLSNEYRTFRGVITNDSILADLSLQVKLKQYLYLVYKHKFLWLRWGAKGVNQVVLSDNPYVKLNYSEFIEIKK